MSARALKHEVGHVARAPAPPCNRVVGFSRLSYTIGIDSLPSVRRAIAQIADAFPVRPEFMGNERFNYADLLTFDVFVVHPWNWEVILFKEMYALSVPLFVPSISQIAVQVLSNTIPTLWHDGPHDSEGADDPIPGVWTNSSRFASILDWLGDTDYNRYPHVQVFENYADLFQQVVTLDHAALVTEMQATNRREAENSLQLVRRMLAPLAY